MDLKPSDFHGFLKSADKLIVGSRFERAFSQLDYREARTKNVQILAGRHPGPATFLGAGLSGFSGVEPDCSFPLDGVINSANWVNLLIKMSEKSDVKLSLKKMADRKGARQGRVHNP